MPTIVNTYQNGGSEIGSLLGGLAEALWGKSASAAELYRQKGAAARRENWGSNTLVDAARAGALDFNDPATRAGLIASGDQQNVLAAHRGILANTLPAGDPRVSGAGFGSGMSWGSTPAGEREAQAAAAARNAASIAEQRRQFNQTPYVVGGPQGPTVSTREQAVGQPAAEPLATVKGVQAQNILNRPQGLEGASPVERAFVGAEGHQGSTTPRMWRAPTGKFQVTYDGVHDANTGATLEGYGGQGALVSIQGTPGEVSQGLQTSLQKENVALQKVNSLLSYVENVAKQDPTLFGATGVARGAIQDVSQFANNVALGLGYNGLNEAVASARMDLTSKGVNPQLLSGLFDPNIPKLQAASDLLVYQAAAALAGQQGRDMSDADVNFFKGIVGNPHEWGMSQEKFMAKLSTVRDLLSQNQAIVNSNLRGNQVQPAAPPAPAAPAPTTPAARRTSTGVTYSIEGP